MSLAKAEQVVKALLYEGYALYPYRRSAVKNRLRWTFGCLLPQPFCEQNPGNEDSQLKMECLVVGGEETQIEVRIRFLQIVDRRVGEPTAGEVSSSFPPGFREVRSLTIDGREFHAWQESIERELLLDFSLSQRRLSKRFDFPASRDCEYLKDKTGKPAGIIVREHHVLRGSIDIHTESLGDGVSKVSLRISNDSGQETGVLTSRDQAILKSLVSTHLILRVVGGEFVSLLDPPEKYQHPAAHCQNTKVWPVLVGSERARDTLLASPIILYDYPQIAPESPGNFFDGTEIDELLSLRIQTLTEEEKREAAAGDLRVHELLARTHGLTDDRMQELHGRLSRQDQNPGMPIVKPGDRVRLRPRGRADAMDVILDGLEATVQSIEQDVDDNYYVAVTIDEDPGRDLGETGQPGHRFFFRSGEIEHFRPEEDRL